MKDLPVKFQFRHCYHTNYTHTAKLNAHGDYEVNWARGWANVIGKVPNVVFDSNLAKELIEAGSWELVDDKPKQKEGLSDEFYFQCESDSLDVTYKAKKIDGKFFVTWDGMIPSFPAWYTEDQLQCRFKEGHWKIITKPVLTAEQQRQVKELREQVTQLDQSIKLNEQDVEHKLRLISNYEARQKDLLDMIAKIEEVK